MNGETFKYKEKLNLWSIIYIFKKKIIIFLTDCNIFIDTNIYTINQIQVCNPIYYRGQILSNLTHARYKRRPRTCQFVYKF